MIRHELEVQHLDEYLFRSVVLPNHQSETVASDKPSTILVTHVNWQNLKANCCYFTRLKIMQSSGWKWNQHWLLQSQNELKTRTGLQCIRCLRPPSCVACISTYHMVRHNCTVERRHAIGFCRICRCRQCGSSSVVVRIHRSLYVARTHLCRFQEMALTCVEAAEERPCVMRKPDCRIVGSVTIAADHERHCRNLQINEIWRWTAICWWCLWQRTHLVARNQGNYSTYKMTWNMSNVKYITPWVKVHFVQVPQPPHWSNYKLDRFCSSICGKEIPLFWY